MWRWARPVGGLVILAVLVAHVGTGPFLDGLRRVDAASLVVAVVLTGATTLAAAWRWARVARAFGIDIPLGDAVAAYYRSQLLNSVLPGGVLGDVDRGVRHGREAERVGRSLAAVATERGVGQVVQLLITAAILVIVPSPVPRTAAAVVAVVLVVAATGAALVLRRRSAGGLGAADLPGLVFASAVVVAGHGATFVVAARAVGVDDTATVVPVALLVLVAMSIPLSIGGWGPREGVAGWAFGAVGLGVGAGVATSVVYGVVALVAVLPGIVVLLAPRWHRTVAVPEPPARVPEVVRG